MTFFGESENRLFSTFGFGVAVVFLIAIVWKFIEFFCPPPDGAIRYAMRIKYYHSKTAIVLESFYLLLALTSVSLFIYTAFRISDREPEAGDEDFNQEEFYFDFLDINWLIWTEFVISMILLADYLWKLFLAGNKMKHIFNIFSISDIITITPAVISVIIDSFMYELEYVRIIRVYKEMLFLLRRMNVTGLRLELIKLVMILICLVFVSAGIIFVVENSTVNVGGMVLNPLDALYFIVISFTTVGYGDIVPVNTSGKIVVILMLLVGVALLPLQISKLIEVFNERRNPANEKFETRKGDRPHVILIPHRAKSAVSWIQEFFHRDHKKATQTRVCILTRKTKIPEELSNFLRDPVHSARISHLSGSPLSKQDLQRARADQTTKFFILADKLATDPFREDSETTLEILSILKFNPSAEIYCQVFTSNNKKKNYELGCQSVVSLIELRMGITALSCISPGISTILNNMVLSYSPKKRIPAQHISVWLQEYRYGLGFEVYEATMTPYWNLTFSRAACVIYDKYGALLIGLIQEHKEKLLINPGAQFRIMKGYKALIAAQSFSDILSIENEMNIEELHSEVFPLIQPIHFLDAKIKQATPFSLEKPKKKKKKSVSLKDITIKDVRNSGIKDHILVVGMWTQILRFLKAFRGYNLKEIAPVLILNNQKPNSQQWKQIKTYEKIFFIQGLSTVDSDLDKAGRQTAREIVILEDTTSMEPTSLSEDAVAVMTYRSVKKEGAFPIIHLLHDSNADLLGNFPTPKDPLENPYYASGKVAGRSTLDTLLSQAFYNRFVVPLMDELIVGRIFSVEIDKHLQEYVGLPFKNLFFDLSRSGWIALGLNREIIDQKTAERRRKSIEMNKPNRPKRYAVTCPKKDLLIRDSDRIYIISSIPFSNETVPQAL